VVARRAANAAATAGEYAKTNYGGEVLVADGDKNSALGRLTQISGLIALFAGIVYALGMIALLVPIMRTYTAGDYSNSWYAVSLIPNISVAGHGLRPLVVGPIAYVAIVAFTLLSVTLWWFWRFRFAVRAYLAEVRTRPSTEGLRTRPPTERSRTRSILAWESIVAVIAGAVGFTVIILSVRTVFDLLVEAVRA
jgi:hypothetical protein